MFKEILEHNPAMSVAQQQANAKATFSKLVIGSGCLKLYEATVELDCNSVTIGLATYSVKDMELLDEICSAKKSFSDKNLYVYDVAQAEGVGDLNKVFPDVGSVFQTPILSTFDKKNKSIWGFDAQSKLKEMMQL
ncbi:MAG: hypothetical protein ACRBHB_03855 [Arenicella sp.]